MLTQRQTLRTARDVCVLGRSEGASLSKEYMSKKGHGVCMRFHHFIPVTGPGTVRRGTVQQAKTLICKAGTTAKEKIRSIRRIASDGFRGLRWASNRPCFSRAVHVRARAARTLLKTARQVFTLHVSRSSWSLPASAIEPSRTRGALALQGQALSEVAAVGDILAVETQSSKTQILAYPGDRARVPCARAIQLPGDSFV